MKKYIIGVIMSLMLLSGCGNKNIEKNLSQADFYMTNNEYEKALEYYESVLNEDLENNEAKNMSNLLKSYLKCVDAIDNENIDKANEYLEDIKNTKNNYVIKDEIEKIEKDLDKIDQEKAKLILEHVVYRSEEHDNGKFNVNGEGKIVLSESDYSDRRARDGGIGMVSNTMPLTSVIFNVKNIGKEPIVNPKVNFKFNGMGIEFQPSERWEGIRHNHGIGTWSEVRWVPPNGTTIQNGMPITINFGFHNAMVSKDGAEIEIILSADNMQAETFKIPVELKQ